MVPARQFTDFSCIVCSRFVALLRVVASETSVTFFSFYAGVSYKLFLVSYKLLHRAVFAKQIVVMAAFLKTLFVALSGFVAFAQASHINFFPVSYKMLSGRHVLKNNSAQTLSHIRLI